MGFWDTFASRPSSQESGTSSLQPWQQERRDRFNVVPGVNIDFMDDAVYDLGRGINNYVLEPLTAMVNPAEDTAKTFLGTGRTQEGGNYSPINMWDRSPMYPDAAASDPVTGAMMNVPGVSNAPQGTGQASSQYQSALEAMAAGGGVSAPSLGAIRADIDSEYNSLIGRLDQMYQLSETPQEKAMIEFALADLQDQYRAAQESIGMVFDDADAELAGYADNAAQTAAGVGDMVRSEYDAGVERSMQQEAMARALLGDQFGDAYRGMQAGAGGARAALDASLLDAAGTREAAYQQSVADMSAEDAAWLQAQQGTLRSANTAEASRLNAALRGNAISQHDQRVSDRVNQERMAMAAAEQQLVQQKMAQQAQLAAQEAEMQAAASRYGAGNRLDALKTLAALEAEGGMGGSPIAFGDMQLQVNDQGRVGPGGAWDAGSLRTALHAFQTQVAGNPESYFSERQALLGELLAGASVPAEGASAAQVEQYVNGLLDQVAPSQYQPYLGAQRAAGPGDYTIQTQNSPRGGR